MSRVLVLVATLTLSACIAPITMSPIRLTTPEAQGGAGRGYLGAGLGNAPNVQIVEALRTPPVAIRDFGAEPVGTATLTFGLRPKVDLEFMGAAADSGLSPWMVRTKVQVFGKPQHEARRGDASVALIVGAGHAQKASSDENACSFCVGGTSGLTATVDTHVLALESGILVGRRVSNGTLVYGGMFVTRYGYSSEVFQSLQGVRMIFPMNGALVQGSGNAGIQGTKGAFIARLEVAFSSTARVSSTSWGFQLGGRW